MPPRDPYRRNIDDILNSNAVLNARHTLRIVSDALCNSAAAAAAKKQQTICVHSLSISHISPQHHAPPPPLPPPPPPPCRLPLASTHHRPRARNHHSLHTRHVRCPLPTPPPTRASASAIDARAVRCGSALTLLEYPTVRSVGGGSSSQCCFRSFNDITPHTHRTLPLPSPNPLFLLPLPPARRLFCRLSHARCPPLPAAARGLPRSHRLVARRHAG